jgi:hypothetical protein
MQIPSSNKEVLLFEVLLSQKLKQSQDGEANEVTIRLWKRVQRHRQEVRNNIIPFVREIVKDNLVEVSCILELGKEMDSTWDIETQILVNIIDCLVFSSEK